MNGIKGFYLARALPLFVKGKLMGNFDGRVEPVSKFHDIAVHIRDNIEKYPDEDTALRALRDTEIWQTYLGVVEWNPNFEGALERIWSQASSTPPIDSPIESRTTTPISGLQPFPAPKAPITPFLQTKNATHGPRPYFAPKIDMINAQDIQSLFSTSNRGTTYSVTTFMVGSPMSVYYVRADSERHASFIKKNKPNIRNPSNPRQGGRFGVCTRTLDLDRHNTQHPHHWTTANEYDLPYKLAQRNKSIVIHGVLCGPDIRDNYEQMPAGKYEFFAYAAVEIDEPSDGNLNIGNIHPTGETTWNLFKQLDMAVVPVHEDDLPLSQVASDHEDILELADGPGWLVDKRGGLVFRNTKTGRAFKVMSEEYMQRYGRASIRNETQDKKVHRME